MEERYLNLRKQLEELGYHQYLKIECVPLVEKLVSDLIHTTESLRKYIKISKDAINERDNLLLGAEPYKCDNAKLVKECNELHLAFLQFREQHDKLQKDLKRRISFLEKQKIDSDLEREKHLTDIKKLELELAHKTSKLLNSESTKLGLKPSLKTSSASTLPKCKCNLKDKRSTMSLAEEKISSLTKEINKLKEDKLELTETNLAYKNQINSRDKEIQRLVSLLEGGRPIQALNQDCCYKDVEAKMTRMQEDIEILQRSKKDLETRLKEAVVKQHEAMKRALNLAERNRALEKEMRDIDQIALAVEADCNSTMKCNVNKVCKLQERVHESVLQIQQLEREVADLKREKQELVNNYDVVKTEKRHLQTVLETALDEKKKLNDRLNQYSIIEHDLNMEIDRLVQTSAAQKQKIAELECRLLSTTGEIAFDPISSEKHKKKGKTGISSPKKKKVHKPGERSSRAPIRATKDHARVPENTPASEGSSAPASGRTSPRRMSPQRISPRRMSPRRISPTRTLSPGKILRRYSCDDPKTCVTELRRLITEEIRNKDVCLNHLKEIIGNEFDHIQSRANMSLDHLKNERDYYMKECQNLMEKMRNLCNNKPTRDVDSGTVRKLMEMEQLISTLQHENRTLSQEKHNLMTRLDTSRDRIDNETDVLTARSLTKRLERERDLLKSDIQRLEEERDAMRQRLNIISENHLQEKSRLEVMLKNAEEDVRKLEVDRRDFMHTQGTRRATINNLQEECDMLKNQLRTCQSEITQQRAYHTQLKTLHEQTDRALADCQSQLHQVEKEMFVVQERLKHSEQDKEHATKEIINLKNDLTMMQGKFAKIDQEKDALLHNLDDKTERIAALEDDLRKREAKIMSMEGTLADMTRKISSTSSEACAKDQMLRTSAAELNRVQQDLEAAIRARDMAYQENRRLQDDLASCTADNKHTQTELEIAKRQVDDLKRQLQHYVAEVKRTEDLISQKEIERTEMLDHFRSLSQEATVLESNNHSLETETAETKVQLSVALDHVTDLERKIESQETMINGYERQISDLTAQIARMEIQIVHQTATSDKIEAELASMKDLCLKLDKQKDTLLKQLDDKETSRGQLNRDLERLRRQSADIQSNLGKERESVESLERLLADSRLETTEQRMLNQELQKEVQMLKNKIRELEAQLVTTTEELDRFQVKALEYSQQNKQLRREIANERFYKAREDEAKRYPFALSEIKSGESRSKMTQPSLLKKKPSPIMESSLILSTSSEEKQISQILLENSHQGIAGMKGTSMTKSENGNLRVGSSDDATGVNAFNKRIGSKSQPVESVLKSLPLSFMSQRRKATTLSGVDLNLEGVNLPQSLIQVSRNQVAAEATGNRQKAPNIDMDSGSSLEITLSNEVTGASGNLKTNEIHPYPNITSVSQNVIDKDYDKNCRLASNIGIVSNRNIINNNTPTPSSSKTNITGSKFKKRVSLSYASDKHQMPDNVEPPQFDSISEVIGESIGEPSEYLSGIQSRNQMPVESTNITSVSKYNVSSPYEQGIESADTRLSNLGLVSENCVLNANGSRSTAASNKVVSISAIKEATREDKLSQSDNCECWKVCTCKSRGKLGNQIFQHSGGAQAITCIIANEGLAPRRYTATYKISYDNVRTNSDTKM